MQVGALKWREKTSCCTTMVVTSPWGGFERSPLCSDSTRLGMIVPRIFGMAQRCTRPKACPAQAILSSLNNPAGASAHSLRHNVVLVVRHAAPRRIQGGECTGEMDADGRVPFCHRAYQACLQHVA